VLVWCRLHS